MTLRILYCLPSIKPISASGVTDLRNCAGVAFSSISAGALAAAPFMIQAAAA